MDAVKKEWITFPSSNGSDTVTGYFYKGTAEPRAVIQLSHGMCEYLAFYDETAEFLVKRGFAVCGNDHLGQDVYKRQEHLLCKQGVIGSNPFISTKGRELSLIHI